MRLLRWLATGIAVLAAGALLLALAARGGDGPLGPFPGGALTTGDWVADVPLDWSFASEVDGLDLQLLHPVGSRRVWLVVHDGAMYIPCGLPTRLKQWPHDARKDGRAVIRLDGKRYRVKLEHVTAPGLIDTVSAISARKYGFGQREDPDPDDVWYFAVRPRDV